METKDQQTAPCRRFAAHRIYTASDRYFDKATLTLKADGDVAGIEPLVEETPRTIWTGGIIVVTSCPPTDTNNLTDIRQFYTNNSDKATRHTPKVFLITGSSHTHSHALGHQAKISLLPTKQ